MRLNVSDIIKLLPFRAFIKGFRHGQQEKLSFRALDFAGLKNHSQNIPGVFGKKDCPDLSTDQFLFQGIASL
jgi:hypothetical protein